VHTDGPGHGAQLAGRAARDGARHIVAVGGDGTVHEVANGMLRQGGAATLGVIAVGTGNDFAKVVGMYRQDPVRAVARLVSARARVFDVGRVGEEYFVNSMGFGFGPEVVRVRNASPARSGRLSYLIAATRAFFGFRAPLLEVRAAEHRERGYMMMVEVCNGTTAGGAYRFAPKADPADGYLDVCLVRRVSLPRFLMATPRVMRGTHTHMKEVALFRTREVRVRAIDTPLLLHLDGELRTPGVAECTVGVVPGCLNVLVAQ
jgi:YegS/Rv2252/BmrU family lipid kinase